MSRNIQTRFGRAARPRRSRTIPMRAVLNARHIHSINTAGMRAAAAGAGRLLLQRRSGGIRKGGGGRLVLPRVADGSCSTSTSIIARRQSNTSSSTTSAAAACAAAVNAAAAVRGAIWLPLPRLAPNMTSGRVQAWLKGEGGAVACYEVIAEVASDNLVEPAHRVGRFKGEVALLLEAQEEGFLAKVLMAEGQGVVGVGAPIAVLCEEEDEVDAVAKGLAALPPTTLQSLDLYDAEAQRLLRICNWQAYLKDPPPEDDAGCGCS